MPGSASQRLLAPSVSPEGIPGHGSLAVDPVPPSTGAEGSFRAPHEPSAMTHPLLHRAAMRAERRLLGALMTLAARVVERRLRKRMGG
jgi:hypothetical protein